WVAGAGGACKAGDGAGRPTDPLVADRTRIRVFVASFVAGPLPTIAGWNRLLRGVGDQATTIAPLAPLVTKH
ncbi:MAG: hypothetical protein M3Z04_18455, partial [Chloroflexota bacterium]|nr:hypothetical protein [Chloroflexota bacterium]